MNKIKIVCMTLLGLLTLTGCTNKDLQKAYDKMQIGSELNEYTVDYRLYGTYNNKNINDIVRITNNNNKYTVEVIDINKDISNMSEEIDKTNEMNQDTETSLKNTNLYKNTDIYLKGLLKTNKVSNKKEEKIGDLTYSVYDIKVDKNKVKEIIKYTNVKDLKIETDRPAKVYIDKDGYVYRIIYELDTENKLYLNVCFFGFEAK